MLDARMVISRGDHLEERSVTVLFIREVHEVNILLEGPLVNDFRCDQQWLTLVLPS